MYITLLFFSLVSFILDHDATLIITEHKTGYIHVHNKIKILEYHFVISIYSPCLPIYWGSFVESSSIQRRHTFLHVFILKSRHFYTTCRYFRKYSISDEEEKFSPIDMKVLLQKIVIPSVTIEFSIKVLPLYNRWHIHI